MSDDGPSAQATAAESSSSALSDVAHRLPFVAGPEGVERPDELPDGAIECSICLQSCIHPVQLPCSHIFCFLCVKGVANHSKRCALCRSEIPPDFLLRPMLLNADDVLRPTQAFDGKYQWFYEGVRGWWQYDVRASTEIEDRYQKGERIFEMLIAGFLYIVDMENMVQYRRNAPSRRRRIKRDLLDIPDKKGVAGLSCKVRPPRRTGGDGGERRDAGSSGGAPGATNNNSSVSSLQQQMGDLTLTGGDGGTDDGGDHSARTSGSRVTDGVGRVGDETRANPRPADAGSVPQGNVGSRGSRVNRQAHDASVNGQPGETARVNRVSSQSVDGRSTRRNRRDIDGLDATSNGQPSRVNSRVATADPDAAARVEPSTSTRINSRVSPTGPDTTADGQPLSRSSGGNRVNLPTVDTPANEQPRQDNRAISQRVKVLTDNRQPISSVVVSQVDNSTVSSQPVVNVVPNSVNAGTRSDPVAPDLSGQMSLPDPLHSSTHRRIEGRSQIDRTDQVDGSSDSD